MAAMAANLRKMAGQEEPAFSTRAIVDACFPDAVVTGRVLPAGVHEMVTFKEGVPLIVYQRRLPAPDQRVAIAHAIGHLCLDFTAGIVCVPFNDPAVEARADRFAAELLVPLAELEPYVGRTPDKVEDSADAELYLDQVDEIASHFNVPAWLIDKQVRRLALLARIAGQLCLT